MIAKRTCKKWVFAQRLLTTHILSQGGFMKPTAYQNCRFFVFALVFFAVSPNLIAADSPKLLKELGVELMKSTADDVRNAIGKRRILPVEKNNTTDSAPWKIEERGQTLTKYENIAYISHQGGVLTQVIVTWKRQAWNERYELNSLYRKVRPSDDEKMPSSAMAQFFETDGVKIIKYHDDSPQGKFQMREQYTASSTASLQEPVATQAPAPAAGDPRQACINGCSLTYGMCTASANFGDRPAYERESDLRRCRNNAEVCQANCR
jgi:hypothetical protein